MKSLTRHNSKERNMLLKLLYKRNIQLIYNWLTHGKGETKIFLSGIFLIHKIETVIRTVSTAFILCIPSYVDNWKSEKRLHEVVISVCGKKEIIRQ